MSFVSSLEKVQKLLQTLTPTMRAWAVGGLFSGLGFAGWAREMLKDQRRASDEEAHRHRMEENFLKFQEKIKDDVGMLRKEVKDDLGQLRQELKDEIAENRGKVKRVQEEIPHIRELERGQIRTDLIMKEFEQKGRDLTRFKPLNSNVQPLFGPHYAFFNGLENCSDTEKAYDFVTRFNCLQYYNVPQAFIDQSKLGPSCDANEKTEIDRSSPKL